MDKPIVSVMGVLLIVCAIVASTFTKNSKPTKLKSSDFGSQTSSRVETGPPVATVLRTTSITARASSSPIDVVALPDIDSIAREDAATDDDGEEAAIRRKLWRTTAASERRDIEWTKRMAQEIRTRAASILEDRTLVIQNLNCRETICRMYLQFYDQLDAEAFERATRESDLKYEFQSLDSEFTGEGFDRSNHTYELMVQRPRPEKPPPLAATESPDQAHIVHAGEDEEIEVTANSE